MKGQLFIIGSVMAVIILAGAGSILFARDSAPPQTPPPTPPASPPSVSQSATVRETAPAPPPAPQTSPQQPPLTFEEKIERLKQAITDACHTSKSRQLTLSFTEAETNEQATKFLTRLTLPEDIPLEVESIQIDFQADNNAAAEVKSVISGWFKATIKAKSHVSIKDGKPDVELTKVSFGIVPLPKAARDKIIGLVPQKIEALLYYLAETEAECQGKVNLEFTGITIQETEATVSVTARPK